MIDSQETRGKICTACNKVVPKLTRVHKGEGYCAACYKRLFVRNVCPQCRNFKRLLKSDRTSICAECFSSLPCIRCKRKDRKVGLLTATGPACASCAPHFRNPTECEVCSKLSTRPVYVSQNGQDVRVCQSCASQQFKTCSSCRRYRAIASEEGPIRLCERCYRSPPGRCPKCDGQMPAGRLNECEACYWRGLLRKRIDLFQVGIGSTELRRDLEAFAGWMADRSSPASAAVKLKRALPIFVEIGQKWRHIPSYEDLIAHFGPQAPRRYYLLFQWLRQSGKIVENKEFRLKATEDRLVAKLLDEFVDLPAARELISAYHGHLLEGRQRTPKSIRLALSPAAAFLKLIDGRSKETITQKTLETFLAAKPGQRAALTGFVNFLRRRFKYELSIKKPDTVIQLRAKRKRLEEHLVQAISLGIDDQSRLKRWISLSFAYFHNLPRKAGAEVGQGDVKEVPGGFEVTWRGRMYWIPRP